jgi:hypothetical protein
MAFIHLAHLLASEHSSMEFEHHEDLFNPKDFINDFPHLFLLCSYVVVGRIFKSITKALGVARMLVLAKPFGGIQQIIVSKVFYRLTNKTFFLQFCDAFYVHLSPH